jgi:hypothetical protein
MTAKEATAIKGNPLHKTNPERFLSLDWTLSLPAPKVACPEDIPVE